MLSLHRQQLGTYLDDHNKPKEKEENNKTYEKHTEDSK